MMFVRRGALCLLTALLLSPVMLVQAQKKKAISHKKNTTHTTKAKTPAGPPPGITFSANESVQLRKSFYLLYLLERKGDAHNDLLKNDVFTQVAEQREQRLQDACTSCKDAACIGQALQWTPDEIQATSNEFKRLVVEDPAVNELVVQLKTVSRYPVYNSDNDTAYIRKVWEDVVDGMNHIFAVYLQGMRPRYPMIDSISFNPADANFTRQVKAALLPYLHLSNNSNEFYKQSAMAAFKALAINGRDEAVRYEPLFKGENAAAFAKSRRVNWNASRFSIIMVPGSGPGKSGRNIDSMGMYRCGLAAAAYKKGVAPFIIVSGGHVHPYKTPFCEAIEMKKYLVGQLGIPDSAVIIEPHARHTTTNIRNAERLMYLFNMPADKPGMIITDIFQTLAITKMAPRFMNELGYLPYKSMEQLSQTEVMFMPDIKAWQQDPNDPLDP